MICVHINWTHSILVKNLFFLHISKFNWHACFHLLKVCVFEFHVFLEILLHVIRLEICIDIKINYHVPTYNFGSKFEKVFSLSFFLEMMCVCMYVCMCASLHVRKSNDVPTLTSFMSIIFSTLTLLLFFALNSWLPCCILHPLFHTYSLGNKVSYLSFSLLGTH